MQMLLALSLVASAGACKDKDAASGGKGSATAKARAPGSLPWEPDSMAHDSPACRKALTCCEAKIAVENPLAKAEDYNGGCSGVALAASDADCEQFRKGYIDALNAEKKSVPGGCE